jgi:arylsulfatase A-like enzyme
MNRRDFLKNTAAGLGLLSMAGYVETLSHLKPKRPNVLIINIDDMGYGDMSCHGNPALKTPNLDNLHSQSIRFTQFHTAPMCAPTRGQLISGVTALRNGARWVGTAQTNLRSDIPTMSEIFKEAGYHTGLFGKWHIGDNYPRRPQDRGFDETVWFPQQEIGTISDYWDNDYFDDIYEHNGVKKRYKGFCTDVWFQESMKWMEKCSKSDRPFMCWLPTNVVHGPYYVDQKYRDMANMPDKHPEVQTFFGMMLNLDENIGKLLEWFDETGLRDDTIILFMTDNGVTHGYSVYNAGMRGYKGHLWEGGHREPLFISWPNGGIGKPRDINELAQVHDIAPTLMELCSIDKPANADFDGMSLVKQIRGEKQMPDRILVVQFQRAVEIKKWDACIMWGPWRLLNAIDADAHDSPERMAMFQKRKREYQINLELYNVRDDPHQDKNIIDKYPEIVRKMKDHYQKWWAKIEPELEIDRPIIIGNDAENPSAISCMTWAETYITQKSDILKGARSNGYWNLQIDREGTYKFELCRWPKEAEATISGSAKVVYADDFVYGKEKIGKALPITDARIQIYKYDKKINVKANDKAAIFTLQLNKGRKKLRTWFYDKDGNWLCGAYYVYIKRI